MHITEEISNYANFELARYRSFRFVTYYFRREVNIDWSKGATLLSWPEILATSPQMHAESSCSLAPLKRVRQILGD